MYLLTAGNSILKASRVWSISYINLVYNRPGVLNTSIAIYQSISKVLLVGRVTLTPWLIPFSASHHSDL